MGFILRHEVTGTRFLFSQETTAKLGKTDDRTVSRHFTTVSIDLPSLREENKLDKPTYTLTFC